MIQRTLLSIVCALSLVNPALAKERKGVRKISAAELASYLVKTGDSAQRPLGTSAPLLGFPGKQSVSVRGDSTDDGEIGKNLEADCDVVVEGQDGKLRPVCLIVNYATSFPEDRQMLVQEYRFALDGSLQHAIVMKAKLDDKGHPVAGSAEDSPLDIKDKETISGARKALNIWLSRTANKIAAEKAAKKKAEKK